MATTQWRLHPGHRATIAFRYLLAACLLVLGLLFGLHEHTKTSALFLISGLGLSLFALTQRRRLTRVLVRLSPTEVVSLRRRAIDRVPLDEIRGVLVGRAARDTWTTWLLLDDGRAVRLSAPAFVFWSRARAHATPDAGYWREIAMSPSGIQATEIHRACVGRPGYAVAPVALLVAGSHLRGRVPRWWSPTGECSGAGR